MNKWQRWKGIMKAYPFEERRLSRWQPPYIVQPKYNGIRCRAINANGSYILLSSEENVIHSVPHINEELDKLNIDAELDGELYCHGMEFEEILSIVSRTVNLHPNHRAIQYHLFDIVNKEPQAQRLNSLYKLTNKPHIVISPFWLCYNLDDVMKVYDNLINNNYEGIIVRHFQCPYERKRSTWVMKFKPKKSDEYEIVGYKEEFSAAGVPKGVLGSLVCTSGNGQTFSVGTGFTEEQRSALWQERESLIGKTCIVKYQHLTRKKSLMFSVFAGIKHPTEIYEGETTHERGQTQQLRT